MREKLSLSRITAYVAGLMLLALGIAASMRSEWGSSPVASVPFMFNLISGIDMGVTTIMWQSFLVFLQFLILRRNFSPWILLQLITGFVFGYCNTAAVWILSVIPIPDTILAKCICTAAGFVVGGFGVWMYSTADVMNMPSEGIVVVIAQKLGKPFHIIKIYFDVTSVVIASAGCLIFLGRFGSVGIGTVVISLMLGTMVGIYSRTWGDALKGIFAKDKPLFPAKNK